MQISVMVLPLLSFILPSATGQGVFPFFPAAFPNAPGPSFQSESSKFSLFQAPFLGPYLYFQIWASFSDVGTIYLKFGILNRNVFIFAILEASTLAILSYVNNPLISVIISVSSV